MRKPSALLAIVFGMALWLRLIGLGGAVTEDEDQWIARAGSFAQGLQTHDWNRTFLTGHPGVTVMWLTSLTLGLERAAPFAVVRGGPDVTVIDGFLPALHDARISFAVLQALLVVGCTALVMRLFGVGVGLIAGVLLAAEPFWAGVGPLVGMDGPQAGFLTISVLSFVLALAPSTGQRARGAWAMLSGLMYALACLTKTTTLLAGPLMPALAALAAWQAWRAARSGHAAGRWWLTPFCVIAAWGLTALLAIWLIWPAMWFAPLGTTIQTITFSADLGSVPHGPGNFFMGQPIEDPGPGFYPVALVLRMGPGTTIGLLLLFTFGAPPAWRRSVWTLVGFVLLFVVTLSVAAKKVDRYILPVLPVLGVLAALGWYEAGRWLVGWWTRRRSVGSQARGGGRASGSPLLGEPSTAYCLLPTACCLLVVVLAFGVQVWPLVMAGRYPLAAYNPLFGGTRMAERAIPIGWGDGLDAAGNDLRRLAGGRTVVTAIWSPLRVNFGAHAPGPVISHLQIAQADFYVDYIDSRQRRLTPRQLVNRKPDAVVTIEGVEYVRIYRLR